MMGKLETEMHGSTHVHEKALCWGQKFFLEILKIQIPDSELAIMKTGLLFPVRPS
jgi:hypothetical protein